MTAPVVAGSAFVLGLLIGVSVVLGAPYLAVPIVILGVVGFIAFRIWQRKRRRHKFPDSELRNARQQDILTGEGLETSRRVGTWGPSKHR
jgi:Flp pilus assembly protein TadB